MAESQQHKKERALATYASLARALHSLDRLLDGQCATFGLSPSQFRVLEYLLLSGPMATGELAERVMCGSSTVSVITRNLAQMGLLTRRAHPSDGRKEMAQLTREGRELVERFCRSAPRCCARGCAFWGSGRKRIWTGCAGSWRRAMRRSL